MAKVAIVGSGFIGRAWAISFARAGHDVSLWDQAGSAVGGALAYIAEVVTELEKHDLTNGQTAGLVTSRITEAQRLEDALDGAVHVQENTPEKLDTKIAVFTTLDRLAGPDTVLSSSTSALLPSHFTEHLAGRHRCLVAHPINPPYLIPAVEIVPAPWTSAEVVENTRILLSGAGQAPIVMQRELDGFIMNRMQGALLEEAFRLVADGYASVEDVDIGIREGLSLRWSFMGPFETIDLNAPAGIRDYAARYQSIYENIFNQTRYRTDWSGPVMDRIEAERRERLAADELPTRQKWRDSRLMALTAHKRKTDKEYGK